MKECPRCGGLNKDDATKCMFCNSPLNEEVNQDIEKAPKDDLMGLLRYADRLSDQALKGLASTYELSNQKEKAFNAYKILAFRGDIEGMDKLGEYYHQNGDDEAAKEWWLAASEKGYEPSKIKLRMIFKENVGSLKVSHTTNESHPIGMMEEKIKTVLPHILALFPGERKSMGTGFIIEGGYVITNAHVVGTNPPFIKGLFDSSIDDTVYMLRPVAIRPELDLAILRFQGLKDEVVRKENHLSLSTDVRRGQEVYTLGHPKGEYFSISEPGYVSNINNRPLNEKGGWGTELEKHIQITISLNGGNSGGPLLDLANDEVLGVTTCSPSQTNGNMGYAVSTETIIQVLNSLKE